MRVFVAGGSGALGRRLVPQLVARGHQVTATATGPAKLSLLAQLGADGVVMDGLDAVSVGEAVAAARPDAIVHQMTALSAAHAGKPDLKHPDRFFAITIRLRSEGTDHLLAAAEAIGPRPQGGRAPLPPWARSVGGGTGYLSWVHLDDAASATVLALEQQATGVFNIADDEPAPASEWLPYLAACAGAKRPVRVPKWMARLLAGELAVIMMTEGRGFGNAKAKRELGWKLRYPSWRQGFKEELA